MKISMNQLKTIIKEEVSIAKEGEDFTISYREAPNHPPTPPVINLSELLRALEFLASDECIESFRGVKDELNGGPFDLTLLKKKFVFGAFPELVRWKRPELVYDEYENEIESEQRQREEMLLRQQQDELQGKSFSPPEIERINSYFRSRPVDRGTYPKKLRESFQPEDRQNIEKRKIIFDKIKSSCEIILEPYFEQLIDVMKQSIEYEENKYNHFAKKIPKEKLQLVKDKISSFTQIKDDIKRILDSLATYAEGISIQLFCKKFLEGEPKILSHQKLKTAFKTKLVPAINYLNRIISILAQTNAKTFHFEGGDFDDYIIGNLIQTSEQSDSLPKKNVSFSLKTFIRDRTIIEEILKLCNKVINIRNIQLKDTEELLGGFFNNDNREIKYFNNHFRKYLDNPLHGAFIDDLHRDFIPKRKVIYKIYYNLKFGWVDQVYHDEFIAKTKGIFKTNKAEIIEEYYDTNIRSYFQKLKPYLEEMKKNLEYQEHDEIMRVVEEIKVLKKNKILNNFLL
jgi:hypothetical protein